MPLAVSVSRRICFFSWSPPGRHVGQLVEFQAETARAGEEAVSHGPL